MPYLLKDDSWKENFEYIFDDYMLRAKKDAMEFEEFDDLLRTFIT